MERRSFVGTAGLAGVLAAGTAPAVLAQGTLRWRLASSFPKALDTIFGAAEVFAKKVGNIFVSHSFYFTHFNNSFVRFFE